MHGCLPTGYQTVNPSSGGRRKKYPGLTDISAHNETPRKRLEKQIFSKRAVKKVASVLDTANARRFHDKFGDTFNYALEK